MTRRTRSNNPIEAYEHHDKQRANNPPVGLVTQQTDPDAGQSKTYAFDPHLDPQMQWAGKAEHTSFEVPTVSLHVHERIDPRTIIETARRQPQPTGDLVQHSLFESRLENPPLREAVEFYQHAHGWSNRMVAGDSLLVMNSLLEKEGMAGKVQMIYIDPPYGIKYGSNFQPFVNKRDVRDGKDEDLTAEPEQIRAFRDTWELGIHSYLTYLRDRLLLARELLTESGSVFVQISDGNLAHVQEIMGEVFGSYNFCALIPFRKKTMPLGTTLLEQMDDFLIWFSKNKIACKYFPLFYEVTGEKDWHYQWAEMPDGQIERLSKDQVNNHSLLPKGARLFMLKSLEPSGPMKAGMFDYSFKGKMYSHPRNGYCTTQDGMKRLEVQNRLAVDGHRLAYKLFIDDWGVSTITIPWQDTIGPRDKIFVVQTSHEVIQRCILMTTDPGDLVFDPTCGSGTTAYVAEQWGRRWITCDTSRVATTLARQRLMTAVFDYYELAHPEEGVGSGFRYKTVPHITLKSIANNEPPGVETLYDQPFIERSKTRVSGPFTMEAVPAPIVKSVEELAQPAPQVGDQSVARSGETLRQGKWRDALMSAGIRGKAGQYIRFTRLEPLPGCRWLHADGETHPSVEGAVSLKEGGTVFAPQRIVVSFGQEHAPMEQRQVEQALEEALNLVPRPKLIAFAAFQFDPEAAKDIDETKFPGVTLLKVQMNADLQTDDLKKKVASADSFWLIGQPDVQLERIEEGENLGMYRISVHGFDYYNTRTGGIESGGVEKIAVWLLDTDYDGRSLFPRQVFFPLAGNDGGWARLARNLRSEIDEDLIEAYRGTVSLPFTPGAHRTIAVKIVDDRGVESLKILGVGDGQ